MVLPQIIQVMDDHDLVLKQPWWLGDPQFVKKPLFMVSERNECTRNSALGSWMGFEICWILQATFMLPSGYVKIAIENGDLVRGFTQLENGGSFHSYVNVYQRVFVTVVRIGWFNAGISAMSHTWYLKTGKTTQDQQSASINEHKVGSKQQTKL